MKSYPEDVKGKTIVQVSVPVSIILQIDEEDAKDMSQDELCGLVDEVIDQLEDQTKLREYDLSPRRWMNRIPTKFAVSRHWDELPIDEMDINYNEGFFERRGDEENDDEC